MWSIVLEELNVKNLEVNPETRFPKNKVEVSQELLQKEGEARDIVRKIQGERKNLGTTLTDKVNVSIESWPEEFEEEIKRKALVLELKKGEFRVSRVTS